jgi:hypothetical protein
MRNVEGEIKDIRDTIQFAMVVIIFFSTLMYGALKAGGVVDTNANLQAIIWGIGIAFHIANYFFSAIIIPQIGEGWMKWIKGSLVVGILAFIDPIIVGATYANKGLSWFPAHAFMVFMYIAFTMPIATFALFILGAYWYMIRDIWHFIQEHLKPRQLQSEEVTQIHPQEH